MTDEHTPDPPDTEPTRDRPPDPSGDDTLGFPTLHGPTSLESAGDLIGPYKLVSRLGEGGFGTVWLAERRAPFDQRVALKLIKPGMDSKTVVARFEQERQALAVLNHPGIAKVIDGGLTPKGRPYFAMEYVKGETITAFCDRQKLGLRDRLMLFKQACEAVQHAHLKGIVHRDIKPANILAFDSEGEGPKVKVIDFGVAKAMSRPLTEKTIFTETGQMIGTPEYMSPEQADPTSADIDIRSDIYSLGVLLYELIAGATPFDGSELRSKAYGEIQRILREVDPPRPSDRLSTISAKDAALSSRIESARGTRIRELAKTLRSELEWIPLKAIRKEPRHRYQTAIQLAEDVENYLEGRPLVAGPESATYRIGKYARRHKALSTTILAVTVSLVAGLSLATWQWQRAEANAAEARTERARADERAIAAEKAERTAQEEREAAVAAKEKAEDLLTVIAIGDALDAARRSDPATTRRELAIVEERGRGDRFDARLARAMSDQSIGEPLRGHKSAVYSVSFSPDGTTLASGSRDHTIRLWDAATGQQIGEPLRGHEGWVTSVSFSPDGFTLASGSADHTIRLWDTATGQQIGEPLRGHESWVTSVSFSPDGNTLASGSLDKTIRLWDVATGRPIGEPLRGHQDDVDSVSFNPDGTTLASGSHDKTIRLWHAVPLRDRIDEIRERRSQMNEVRTMLTDRIARVGPTKSDVHAFAEEVRADPRFAGELRMAALLVVGELDLARSEAESPPSASDTTPAD